jgi:diguanylate cyclase (GGDEF)-like protein
MHFRSLQARIVMVFLGLLLAIQVAGYGVIHRAIGTNALLHAQDQLAIGERVFKRLLTQNGQRLEQAAQTVASDFALREALGTKDQASVATLIRRHADRARGDLVMLVGLDGRVLGDHASWRWAPEAVTRHVLEAKTGARAPAIGILGDQVYQFVAMPVRPTAPMGWIVLGSMLDDNFARDLAELTNLDVSIVRAEARNASRIVASTLSTERRQTLVSVVQVSPGSPSGERLLSDPESQRLWVPLDSREGPSIAAILERPFAEATAPFAPLQFVLLVLTAIGLAMSALGSMVMARRITGPLRSLVDVARNIEQGDYRQRVVVDTNDEIGDLACAFNHMCQGIAAREQRISQLAYTDALTDLPNRALFNDRINQAVVAAERSRGRLAIVILDLDRFKFVNDTLGHHMGDMLLREVADRLHRTLQRRSDTIARLGGDEFAVLLPTEGLDDAKHVARRILELLSEPLTIEGHIVDVGASIGIAVFPEHGSDADTLMRHADVAMYSAKRARSGFEVYDRRYDQNTPAHLSLLGELRQALEHDQLTVLYQPKMDLAGNGTHAVEALLRWEHPRRGIVSPDGFIPFAEQTGYIKAITRYVLNRVFRQCVAWRARGRDIKVSVNISARDLHNPDFPRSISELADLHGAKLEWLCLEITESAVMEDPTYALEILRRLDAMGIELSIDDFGTGYSSLAYLKRLPVDELKIDRSFVKGLSVDTDDAAIVRATIDLAHHLGLKVTAEGVENGGVLKTLRQLKCDSAQGYYVSPPIPAQELERWMEEESAVGGRKAMLVVR